MSPSGTGPQLSRQQAEELYQDLLAAASRRWRRRTIVRVVGVAVSAVFILITLIWATAALSGLGHRTMVGSGNGEPTPNYRFEDVTVTGYVDPRTGEVDPGKAAILAQAARVRQAVLAAADAISESDLDAPPVGQNVPPRFATRGEVWRTLVAHETMHAGQLTVIRRELGLGPVLG